MVKGWGSLSLYLAQKYPKSRIVGLSNSTTQKAHIDGVAKSRGLANLEVRSAEHDTAHRSQSAGWNVVIADALIDHHGGRERVRLQQLPTVRSSVMTDGGLLVFCTNC